ncbi:MAG: D-alanyl-D-alanine carboxypeptidase/D-alanyl-D-alanine endopeptidase [Micromonosporaceae bacterium]
MRGRFKILLGVTALALVATGSTASAATASIADLTKDIDEILADARLNGSEAGVLVRDADTEEVLYARNIHTRLLPASNNKLLTAAAALEVLGPDYTFTTSVRSDGKRAGSQLNGDLYLRGGGDPTTLAEDYDSLAEQIADSGVRSVQGKLIADDTFFDSERLGSDWASDDESAYFAAQISALTVAPDTDYDAGSVKVHVTPGASAGSPAKVKVAPETDYVRISNRAVTGSSTGVAVTREHGSNTIVVSGTIGADAEVVRWSSVWEPTGYAADVFGKALARHGVKVESRAEPGSTPEGAKVLASHDSMPLSELLVPFLKLSNNGHAEVLTKAMGREVYQEGSWSAGLQAAEDTLASLGPDMDSMRMEDGSGLSRRDMTTPSHLGELLAAAQGQPWYEEFRDALPVAGAEDRFVGGTLRSRMRGTPAAGNVIAKTGSLTGVTALSGYVTSADGERLIFSIMFNNYLSGKPSDLEDRIAIRLARFSRSEESRQREPYRVSPPKYSNPRSGDLECSWLKAC